MSYLLSYKYKNWSQSLRRYEYFNYLYQKVASKDKIQKIDKNT